MDSRQLIGNIGLFFILGLFLETVFIVRGLVKMEGGGSRRGEARRGEVRGAGKQRVESREQRAESTAE